jgi:hypothetical protein
MKQKVLKGACFNTKRANVPSPASIAAKLRRRFGFWQTINS